MELLSGSSTSNTPGPPGADAGTGANVSTRAAMALIATPTAGAIAILTEVGASGSFVFLLPAAYNAATGRTLTADVTTDATKGIIVPPSADTSGTSGAWVRLSFIEGKQIAADWFLVTPGAFSTSAIIQKIEDLRGDGQDVWFSRKTYAFGGVKVLKGGEWSGTGKGTVIQHVHVGGTIMNTFSVMAQGKTRFHHMRFTGLSDVSNADAKFPLYFSTRYAIADTDTGIAKDPEDIECDHLWFDTCDTGIRASYDGIGPTNDRAGTTWYTPRRIHVHDCVFDDVLYQPVIPEGHDITVERCYFKLTAKPAGGYRPFSHSLRVLGCNRVDIRQNRFEVPADYTVIAPMASGVDNGITNDAFRMARNVTIEDNRFIGGFIQIQHSADLLRIVGNNLWNNPAETATYPISFVFIGSAAYPAYFGKVQIEDNYAVGYPAQITLENVALHQLSIKRNTIIGNKKSGGIFDIVPLKIQVNTGTKLQDGVTDLRPPVLIEIEDNCLFCNPSTTGSYVYLVGDLTGLHLSYTGNKLSERAYNINHIVHSGPSGTTPKVSVSRSSAWVDMSALTGVQQDIAGDNRAMPTGFYAALMASTLFRPEQVVDNYPPTFA